MSKLLLLIAFALPSLTSASTLFVECNAYQIGPNGKDMTVPSGKAQIDQRASKTTLDSSILNQAELDYTYTVVVEDKKFRFLVIKHTATGIVALTGKNGNETAVRLQFAKDNYRDVECYLRE